MSISTTCKLSIMSIRHSASACIVACYGVNIFTKNENILHYLNSFGFRKENVVHVFRHTTSGRPFFYVRIIFRNALN